MDVTYQMSIILDESEPSQSSEVTNRQKDFPATSFPGLNNFPIKMAKINNTR